MNQLLTDLVKEVGREKIAEITDVHVSTTYRWMSDNEDRPSTYIPMLGSATGLQLRGMR